MKLCRSHGEVGEGVIRRVNDGASFTALRSINLLEEPERLPCHKGSEEGMRGEGSYRIKMSRYLSYLIPTFEPLR